MSKKKNRKKLLLTGDQGKNCNNSLHFVLLSKFEVICSTNINPIYTPEPKSFIRSYNYV